MVTCIARRDMNIVYHTLQHKSTYLRDTTLAVLQNGGKRRKNYQVRYGIFKWIYWLK